MKSILFNPNFSWPTVLGSVAWTLTIDVIMEFIIFRRYQHMKKVLMEVNGLISKTEMKILNRAAKILQQSDKHDQYFFDRLVELGCVTHGPGYEAVTVGCGFKMIHDRLPVLTSPVKITSGSTQVRITSSERGEC